MIRDHESQWGWYQIDRAITHAGILGVNVHLAMLALVAAELVVADGDPQKASTHYSITTQGLAFLSS